VDIKSASLVDILDEVVAAKIKVSLIKVSAYISLDKNKRQRKRLIKKIELKNASCNRSRILIERET